MHKLFLIAIVLTINLTSCLSEAMIDGLDTVIRVTSNKRLDKKIIFFYREAGATVPNSYQVTILDNSDTFDSTSIGNTFTFDNYKTKFDSSSINFMWFSNDTLQITYESKLRIFIQNKNVQGVTIIYRPR